MAAIIKPKALKKGDTIAIVAPASPAPKDKMALGVKRLKQAGFNVYVDPQCYRRRGYMAGDDKLRARSLMRTFADKRFKAVICARGGFGCHRLLKHLDFDIIKKNPKIFVGFSDITILHSAFQKIGLVTFHGAMPSIDICRKDYHYSLDNLIRALTSTEPLGRLENPKSLGSFKRLHGGQATGVLVGGNISLLDKLVGTPYMPSFKNKIVLLEDTDEEPYRIDGYFGHLFAATDIADAAGFIFGEWVKVEIKRRNYPSLTLDQVINDFFKNIKVPILANAACGHGRKVMTVPLGVNARIDADRKRLEIIEKAVS